MSDKPDDVGLWMPFYVSDYLAKTTRLSTLHHGVYLLMLLDLWKNGPIPDDDEVLARVAGLDVDAWSIARRTMQAFFMIRDGVWTHERVEEELEKARNNRKSASAKASKAASARWDKQKRGKKNAPSNAASISGAILDKCPSPSPSPKTPSSSYESADKPADDDGKPSTDQPVIILGNLNAHEFATAVLDAYAAAGNPKPAISFQLTQKITLLARQGEPSMCKVTWWQWFFDSLNDDPWWIERRSATVGFKPTLPWLLDDKIFSEKVEQARGRAA